MNVHIEKAQSALKSGGGSAMERGQISALIAVAEEIRALREALTSANTAEKPEEKPVEENTDAHKGTAETPVRLLGPLADYRMSDLYQARHVHSRDGRCVKNIYGENCTAKTVIHARNDRDTLCGLSGQVAQIAVLWKNVNCDTCQSYRKVDHP